MIALGERLVDVRDLVARMDRAAGTGDIAGIRCDALLLSIAAKALREIALEIAPYGTEGTE